MTDSTGVVGSIPAPVLGCRDGSNVDSSFGDSPGTKSAPGAFSTEEGRPSEHRHENDNPTSAAPAMWENSQTKPRPANGDYETPGWLYRRLDAEFGFVLDAFASDHNAKCRRYLTREDDAFTCDWFKAPRWRYSPPAFGLPLRPGPVFLNPPYASNKLGRAVRRAADVSATYEVPAVALVCVSVNSKWFHEAVIGRAAEVRFFDRRISYEYQGKPVRGNDRDSMLIVWRPGVRGPQFGSMRGKP